MLEDQVLGLQRGSREHWFRTRATGSVNCDPGFTHAICVPLDKFLPSLVPQLLYLYNGDHIKLNLEKQSELCLAIVNYKNISYHWNLGILPFNVLYLLHLRAVRHYMSGLIQWYIAIFLHQNSLQNIEKTEHFFSLSLFIFYFKLF